MKQAFRKIFYRATLFAPLLAGAPALAGPVSTTLPDTEAGRIGAAAIAQINAGSPEQTEAWAPTILSSAFDQAAKEAILTQLHVAARESGGVDFVGLEGAGLRAVVPGERVTVENAAMVEVLTGLQAGDVVTIFSTVEADIPKSRRTALIKVTGEVGAPGYYQVAPGETLRVVLVKAGGVTADAYLFGTKLNRKSLMKLQEEQYKKALEQAERLLLAATNINVASALNPAEAATVQAQAATQRQYLERLRGTKPDGRVVLDVQPKASSIAEMPPLVLEDGDSITVPSVPGQIAIFGSVYSQGAFAYESGKTVFDYLSLAGGAAKSSDKGSIFVLRANGTVDSAQQGWVPFVSGLYGKNALPGDAIYVPEDFQRVSFIKSLVDISQIFFQVGLGAAAVNSLQN